MEELEIKANKFKEQIRIAFETIFEHTDPLKAVCMAKAVLHDVDEDLNKLLSQDHIDFMESMLKDKNSK